MKFTDRRCYYDAFDSFYRDNDPGVMVRLIAQYVNEQLDHYLEIVALDDKSAR